MVKKPKKSTKKQNYKVKLPILVIIPVLALLAKLFWLAITPGHGFYGSDGENYLSAVAGLDSEGLFSKATNLYYWPAGYSILVWFVSALNKPFTVTAVGIIQSFFYAYGCLYFIKQLQNTRLKKYSLSLTFVLAFNPTLSLHSMVIGYETPAATLLLLSFAFLIKLYQEEASRIYSRNSILASISFTLASFMQPRLLLIGFVMLTIFGFAKFRLKISILFLIVTFSITLITPAFMIFRNERAMGFAAISTNLGRTMQLGAGDEASGAYSNKPKSQVVCIENVGNPAQNDKELIKCVLNWYVKNPNLAIGLFIRKSVFFWSPWSGPMATGTTMRNPWLKIDPVVKMSNSESGYKSVFGNFGILISWIWILGQIFFLYLGARFLWRANGVERLMGIASLSAVLISWITALLTIGDHRFRIPTMGLSLFLQIVGFMALFGGKTRLVGSQTPLRWKTFERNANLHP